MIHNLRKWAACKPVTAGEPVYLLLLFVVGVVGVVKSKKNTRYKVKYLARMSGEVRLLIWQTSNRTIGEET